MAVTSDNRTPIEQREFLYGDTEAAQTGFSPRAVQRLALVRAPCSNAKIEMQRRLRGPPNNVDCHPIWEYQTWVEIGRLPPMFPVRPDKPYDSNLWRCLTLGSQTEGPVSRASSNSTCDNSFRTIPPPSRMAGNTFVKFLSFRALFLDKKRKEQVIAQMEKEQKESERLILRSECRDPPRDSLGNILPPKDFKRYRATRTLRKQPTEPPSDTCDEDLFKAPQHHWKQGGRHTLKENSPVYKELMMRYKELVTPRSERPHCNSRMTTDWSMWGNSN